MTATRLQTLGLAVAGAALLSQPTLAAPRVPPARQTVQIEGLSGPGKIILDHAGVPHIFASTAKDAFFLQGYAVARDRLWQIDLWRKRGLGRLAASFGPAFAAQDEASRLFLYRGDMKAEWAAYPREAKGWTEAFVAGINAYVGEVRAGRRPLPAEFRLTGSAPETWSADEVVRIRSNALVSNLTEEVARARALCRGDLKLEPLRRTLDPPHVLKIPDGLDPCAVPANVLDTFLLATAGVRFDGKKIAAAADAPQGPARQEEGSNNWVIAPGRSSTGRPILANDPHREHAVPSLRYLVHLDAPGLHLAGAGEPALPGIAFGHNDSVAWGLTIFPADQQDLYVYDLVPGDPSRYLYQGREEAMRVEREVLEVKGEAPRPIELKFTRHGPVIAVDPASGHAFAVRSVWSEPGASAYFNAAWMFKATSFADFQTTRDHWKTPALNLVYADRRGEIGWMAAAAAPARPNWDGLLPVPGDGRYEWNGLLPPEDLPSLRNPKEGFIATANAMNLPASYPNETRKISFYWTDRSRIDRISAVLAATPKASLDDSRRLQTDVRSKLAERALKLAAPLEGETDDQRAALRLLSGWDGAEGVDSAPAALFEIWIAHTLRQTATRLCVPEAAREAFDPDAGSLITALAANDPALGPDPSKTRRDILLQSLGAAFAEARTRLGPDPQLWRWGRLHQAAFAEPVAVLAPPGERAVYGVGPQEIGGSGSTPMAASYRAGNFNVAAGASVRMVLDVGGWDASTVINTPGQSGDPQSPHFRDLFPLWAKGAYAPFPYSKGAVEAAAETIIEVAPPAGGHGRRREGAPSGAPGA